MSQASARPAPHVGSTRYLIGGIEESGASVKRHQKVAWIHTFKSDPITIFSEICDEEEVRKVELFADGRMTFADERTSSGTTFLAEVAMPSLEEIGRDLQFVPEAISETEFENIWVAATSQTPD